MRQLFQTVVVLSLTLGTPCIIFAQGGGAAASPPPQLPAGTPLAGPLIPYVPQSAERPAVPAGNGWRQGRHRLHAENHSFAVPCDALSPLPSEKGGQAQRADGITAVPTASSHPTPATPPQPAEGNMGTLPQAVQNGTAAPAQPVEGAPVGQPASAGASAHSGAAPAPQAAGEDKPHQPLHSDMGRAAEDCTDALTAWLSQMTPDEQTRARHIMDEAAPRLRGLKDSLRAKMKELQALTYGQETDPQILPALGQELQQLRRQLGQEFMQMNLRLVEAVGRPLPPPPGRGFRSLSNAVPE